MLILNGNTITQGQFPNKETYCDLDDSWIKKENKITVKYENDSDVLQLCFLKDYIDEVCPDNETIVEFLYLPYSRMDRKQENRLFSLKHFINMLKKYNFKEIIANEVHSDISVHLGVTDIHKSIQLTETILKDISASILNIRKKFVLVFPDKGARDRYENQTDFPNIVSFDKKRDFNSGQILSIEIIPDDVEKLEGKDTAIIVDDLCSRGGTFIGSAKKLKELGIKTVYLVTTHTEKAIFDGDIFKTDAIDFVYTTDSIISKEDVIGKDKISILSFSDNKWYF